LMAVVPTVFVVEAEFIDKVPPELMVPVNSNVPELVTLRLSLAAVPVKVTPAPASIVPVEAETVMLPPDEPPARVSKPPTLSEQVFMAIFTVPDAVAAPFRVAAPLTVKVSWRSTVQVIFDWPVLVGALTVSDPTVRLATVLIPLPMVMVWLLAVALAVKVSAFVTTVVVASLSVKPFAVVGLAMVSAVNVTVPPVLPLVIVRAEAIVTGFWLNNIPPVPDPNKEMLALNVVVPLPALN